MGNDDHPPLFVTKSTKGSTLVRFYALIILVCTCLIFVYRLSHIPAKQEAGRWVVLGSTFSQSGFSSFVLRHFFLLGVGFGLEMEWAKASRTFWPHNSPSKSCCPAPRTGRKILMFSGLHHGRLSLVSLWVSGFFRLPMARSWRFGVRGALSSMFSFWG